MEVCKMLIKSATFYENQPNLMPKLTKNLEFLIDRYYS